MKTVTLKRGVLTFTYDDGKTEPMHDRAVIIDEKGKRIKKNGTYEFVIRHWQVLYDNKRWGLCIPLIMYPEDMFTTRFAYTVKPLTPTSSIKESNHAN